MNGSFISLSKYVLSVCDGHSFALDRIPVVKKQEILEHRQGVVKEIQNS